MFPALDLSNNAVLFLDLLLQILDPLHLLFLHISACLLLLQWGWCLLDLCCVGVGVGHVFGDFVHLYFFSINRVVPTFCLLFRLPLPPLSSDVLFFKLLQPRSFTTAALLLLTCDGSIVFTVTSQYNICYVCDMHGWRSQVEYLHGILHVGILIEVASLDCNLLR